MGTAATAVVGVDVSKAMLDCCLLHPDGVAREKAFANDPGGHAALLAWADRHAGTAPPTSAWRRPAGTRTPWPPACTPPAGP